MDYYLMIHLVMKKIELFHKTGACISIDNSGNIEFKSKGKIIFDATQIELGKGATQKIILGISF